MKPAKRNMGAKIGASASVLLMAVILTACGKGESKSGQALVSVDGDEITISQLNEEMQRANVPSAQQEAASKQLLDSLVERQLLLNAAVKDKLDRDPKVVQAMERAKALILAQSYLQKQVGAPAAPSKADVESYYKDHPELFSNRKQFDMRQIQLTAADMTPEVKAVIDKATSLDEVGAWLDGHQIKYTRGQISRTSSDLPPELTKRLLTITKSQLFIIREGDRNLLNQLVDVKDAPLTLEAVAPQLEQFLVKQKEKEKVTAEVTRLRSAAKISYLNAKMEPAAKPAAAAPAASTAEDSTARGVAGLK